MVIVTDEDAAKSAKAPVTPRAQGPSDPPAYSVVGERPSERDAMLASSSHHPHHHHYHRPDLEGLPHHHKAHDEHQRRSFFSRHSIGSGGSHYTHGRTPGHAAFLRFFHALLIAILCYFFFGFLVRSIVEIAKHGRVYLGDGGSISKDWPEFPSGEVKDCASRSLWNSAISTTGPSGDLTGSSSSDEMVDWNFFNGSSGPSSRGIPWRSSKTVKFSISDASSLDTLYFLSRGSLATGSVRVFTKGDKSNAEKGADDSKSGSGGDEDTVQVTVRVYYHTQAALDRANVCKLERSGGKDRGVGIFTPRNWHTSNPLDYLRFEVEIVLPAETRTAMSATPKQLKRLETDYSNFALRLGVLRFNSMDMLTSNAPIISDSINANVAGLRTSNGDIIGSYNVSSSLKLITTNGKIQTDVNLQCERASKPTELFMRTSNGAIDSNLNLVATKSATDSAFIVQSITSNNHNNIVVESQPLGAKLVTVDSKTSNEKATVLVPPPFEGSFTLRTSNAQPHVVSEEVKDPANEGRQRQLTWDRIGQTVSGQVTWGTPRAKPKSWVHVESSNAPVTLFLRETN